MSDFQKAVSYLDYVKSRQATKTEAANSPNRFDKYYSFAKTRDIKKIPGVFYLPEHYEVTGDTNQVGFIVFQYNVTLSEPVYILNAPALLTYDGGVRFQNCFLCIRWRVGNTVYRYRLTDIRDEFGFEGIFGYFNTYTNQLVPVNFVIEYWIKWDVNVLSPQVGSVLTRMVTSIEVNPQTADEIEHVLVTPTFVRDELFVALPETIPTPYDAAGPYLTN